jgi:hypothetical protein
MHWEGVKGKAQEDGGVDTEDLRRGRTIGAIRGKIWKEYCFSELGKKKHTDKAAL